MATGFHYRKKQKTMQLHANAVANGVQPNLPIVATQYLADGKRLTLNLKDFTDLLYGGDLKGTLALQAYVPLQGGVSTYFENEVRVFDGNCYGVTHQINEVPQQHRPFDVDLYPEPAVQERFESTNRHLNRRFNYMSETIMRCIALSRKQSVTCLVAEYYLDREGVIWFKGGTYCEVLKKEPTSPTSPRPVKQGTIKQAGFSNSLLRDNLVDAAGVPLGPSQLKRYSVLGNRRCESAASTRPSTGFSNSFGDSFRPHSASPFATPRLLATSSFKNTIGSQRPLTSPSSARSKLQVQGAILGFTETLKTKNKMFERTCEKAEREMETPVGKELRYFYGQKEKMVLCPGDYCDHYMQEPENLSRLSETEDIYARFRDAVQSNPSQAAAAGGQIAVVLKSMGTHVATSREPVWSISYKSLVSARAEKQADDPSALDTPYREALKHSKEYGRRFPSNLYKMVKVCTRCYQVYIALDFIRNSNYEAELAAKTSRLRPVTSRPGPPRSELQSAEDSDPDTEQPSPPRKQRPRTALGITAIMNWSVRTGKDIPPSALSPQKQALTTKSSRPSRSASLRRKRNATSSYIC
eukprot:GILK01004590.1.p1 GENE.GILK01004590.1~~GILK01004590.1.p1  ORF type:complete len:673 (-),score=70.87 GILK01004590.1:186-1931(-)